MDYFTPHYFTSGLYQSHFYSIYWLELAMFPIQYMGNLSLTYEVWMQHSIYLLTTFLLLFSFSVPACFSRVFCVFFFPSELAIFMHQYWQSNNRSVKFQNETDFQKIKGKREERDFHSQFINKMTNMFTQSLESAFKISLQKNCLF